ncbi:hypothetical protein CPB97_012130 [Podila verticillata]|nr:hypothetical protein CPB97_012130 [Podila verticillata]
MTWIGDAPKDPPPNAALLKDRLITAFDAINDPSNSKLWNERSGRAAAMLRDSFALVVDAGDQDTTTVPLAEYIVRAMNGTTSVIDYPLEDGHLYPVHQKSTLFLTALSKKLRISIYLFSARARPLDFLQDEPLAIIGILDQANSYIHTVGRFAVLTAPKDLHPTKSWHQLQLSSSTPAAATASTPPPGLTEAEIPKHVALFRKEGRGRAKQVFLDSEYDNDDVWEEAIRHGCVTSMDKVIDKELGRPLKKRCLEGTAKDDELAQKKVDILKTINKNYCDNLPRGSKLHMLKYVHSKYTELKDTNRFHLGTRINGLGGDLPFWKDTILHHYDERFGFLTSPTAESSPGPTSAPSAPPAAVSSSALSSTVSATKADVVEPSDVLSDNMDSIKESFRQDSRDEDDGKDATGILTLTLSETLQPWLMEHLDAIDDLATETQDRLTTEMTHLTFLAQKVLIVVGEGNVYRSLGYETRRRVSLKALIPQAEVDMELPVNPLPRGLQQHIQDHKDDLVHDAIGSLFTQNHLQDIFYEFVGVERHKRNMDNIAMGTPRALWNSINQAIKDRSNMSSIPQAAVGYSKVTTAMIRKMATNIRNIWQGKTYTKLLDRLLKTVVAAQLKHDEDSKANLDLDDLCCDCEEDNIGGDEEDEEVGENDDDMDMKPQASSDMDPLPMSTWRCRSKYLCDELSIAIHGRKGLGRRDCRIHHVKEQMIRLLARKPVVHPSGPQADGTSTEGVLDQDESGYHEPEQGDDDEDDVEKKQFKSKRLSQLVRITRMLVESPELQYQINANWLRSSDSSVIKQAALTDQEMKVIVITVRLLADFIPKRVKVEGQSQTKAALSHPALRLPLVLLANTVFVALGRPKMCLRMSPKVSAGARYALPLGPAEGFEVWAGKQEERFDTKAHDGVVFTSAEATIKDGGTRYDFFNSLFDMVKIQELAKKFKYELTPRMVYVSRFDIKFLCNVVPHNTNPIPQSNPSQQKRPSQTGSNPAQESVSQAKDQEMALDDQDTGGGQGPDKRSLGMERSTLEAAPAAASQERGRGHQKGQPCEISRSGYPTKSFIKDRKKRARSGQIDTTKDTDDTRLTASKADLKTCLEQRELDLRNLEERLSLAKKETAAAERARKKACFEDKGWCTPSHRRYLRRRDRLRIMFARQQEIQEKVDTAKKEVSWMKQHCEGSSSGSTSCTAHLPNLTVATEHFRRIEEESRRLDLDALLRDSTKLVALGSTDYGVKKMSETVALPLPVLEPHVNRFVALEADTDPSNSIGQENNNVDTAAQRDVLMAGASSDQATSPTQVLKAVPKTHTVTAPYLSTVSHTRKNAKRRAKRLKKDNLAQEALKAVSKAEVNQARATTLEQLDISLATQRQYGSVVSAFENKKRHLKEKSVQQHRKKVAYQKVTAHERRGIIEAARNADGEIMNNNVFWKTTPQYII